jgi:hypothetical protein
LARKGSNAIYNIIPKTREWLIVKYVVNAARGVIHGFYIFKCRKLRDDYIRLYKLGIFMAMQKKHG